MDKCFKDMKGAYAALYTPFRKDGSLNEEMIERQIAYGLKKGLRGFYLTGSTGEGFKLSNAERKAVFERAVKASNGKAKLIAHVGCLATQDAVELARHAAKVGIDWVSSVAPVYFGQNWKSAYEHYKAISEATDLPFMIYSLGADIVPDRDAKFFELRNVKGMKYTNYKYWHVQALARKLPKEAIFFSGADEQALSALATGLFAGNIGTSQNTIPGHFAKICELAAKNDFKAAAKLQDQVVQFVELLLADANYSYIKAMNAYIGLDVGPGRGPGVWEFSAADRNRLYKAMDRLGFIRRNDAK